MAADRVEARASAGLSALLAAVSVLAALVFGFGLQCADGMAGHTWAAPAVADDTQMEGPAVAISVTRADAIAGSAVATDMSVAAEALHSARSAIPLGVDSSVNLDGSGGMGGMVGACLTAVVAVGIAVFVLLAAAGSTVAAWGGAPARVRCGHGQPGLRLSLAQLCVSRT